MLVVTPPRAHDFFHYLSKLHRPIRAVLKLYNFSNAPHLTSPDLLRCDPLPGREVTDERSPLYGELEVYFRRRCEKGTMIPWAGELVLQGETPSKYGESKYYVVQFIFHKLVSSNVGIQDQLTRNKYCTIYKVQASRVTTPTT